MVYICVYVLNFQYMKLAVVMLLNTYTGYIYLRMVGNIWKYTTFKLDFMDILTILQLTQQELIKRNSITEAAQTLCKQVICVTSSSLGKSSVWDPWVHVVDTRVHAYMLDHAPLGRQNVGVVRYSSHV